MLDTWKRYERFPLGKAFFSWILWLTVPYTGSVRPYVLELAPGRAKIRMRDRRLIRNHLKSIHAAALMNLAEVTSGLAFLVSLPPKTRAIVTGFQMEYLKKARGTLTSECDCPLTESNSAAEHTVQAILKDSAGDIVAKGTARWKIGPER